MLITPMTPKVMARPMEAKIRMEAAALRPKNRVSKNRQAASRDSMP